MGAPAYIVVGLGELEICAMLSHMLCCVRNEKNVITCNNLENEPCGVCARLTRHACRMLSLQKVVGVSSVISHVMCHILIEKVLKCTALRLLHLFQRAKTQEVQSSD